MSLKRNLALLAALGVAATGVGASGADFTSRSAGTGNGVSAARDFFGPTVALANPGSPLQGTVTLTATASDAVSGVASVTIQGAPNGSSSFTAICTDTSAPYSCAYDTTTLPTGKYDLRAVATDVDGNVTTSTLVDSRWVDNTSPATTIAVPAGPLRGAVALTGTATSATGVDTVAFQRAPTGTTTWTTVCTSTTATPSCSWDTTQAPDGTYDLRTLLTTTSGRTATSTVVTGRRVDNTAPTAVGVAATAAARPGRLDTGDTLVLTFSEAMQRSSLVAGWTSGTVPVNMRFAGNPNVITFTQTGTGGVPALGSVQMTGDYRGLLAGTTNVVANATLSTDGTTLTLALTTTPASALTAAAAGNMTWTPPTSALDLAGNAASATPYTEPSPADVDF